MTKLHNVEKAIEKVALSGLDFITAAMSAGDEKMEVYKSSMYASQAEVAAMICKLFTQAMQDDLASLNANLN